jgi:hypothetical protein
MNRRALLGAAVTACALTLVAGCGGSSSGSNDSSAPPATEFANSLHALTSGSSLTSTLSLQTTGSDLLAIASAHGGTDNVTQTQANLIAGARLTVETIAPSGKTLAATPVASDMVSVTGSSEGTTYFSLRALNQSVYLQLDLKDILDAAGMSSEYQTLVTRTASFPAFVSAFIAGKWIALPDSAAASIEALLQGAESGKIPTNSQAAGLVGQLESTIANDVTVARTSTGSTDQFTLTANVHTVASDIVTTIQNGLPSVASQLGSADQVPDRSITVDGSVTHGAVSKLSFNTGQLSTNPFQLPLVASFARSGASISAPTGATQVSLQDLISLATLASGGSGSS